MVRDEEKTDQILHGISPAPVVSSKKDPTTFFGFCMGEGLPRATDDLSRPHGHYSFCSVWELEKQRIWERKRMMKEPRRRGMSEAAEAVISGAVRDIDRGDAISEWMAEAPA